MTTFNILDFIKDFIYENICFKCLNLVRLLNFFLPTLLCKKKYSEFYYSFYPKMILVLAFEKNSKRIDFITFKGDIKISIPSMSCNK